MKHTKEFLLLILLLLTAACSSQNIGKEAENEDQGDEVSLTRSFQRVIRYNCQGVVTSDTTETVGAPTRLIEIRPRVFSHLHQASFYNLTTSTYPKCAVDIYKFNVDYSEGYCNMRVQSGGNQIRYSFVYCDAYNTVVDPTNGSTTTVCAHTPEKREEGTTWIRVSYTEKTLDGFSEVRPSPQDCPVP